MPGEALALALLCPRRDREFTGEGTSLTARDTCRIHSGAQEQVLFFHRLLHEVKQTIIDPPNGITHGILLRAHKILEDLYQLMALKLFLYIGAEISSFTT
jgi:hypothetical protein